MKNILPAIFLFWLLMLNCKKTNFGKVYQGTVIGFDPCTGNYTNNSKKGFVIKIDTISEDGTVITIDTVATYNLPIIFNFTSDLFTNYKTSYLFPTSYRDSFRFKFSFRTTPENQKTLILCLADIFYGAFYSATKGKQIIVTKIY